MDSTNRSSGSSRKKIVMKVIDGEEARQVISNSSDPATFRGADVGIFISTPRDKTHCFDYPLADLVMDVVMSGGMPSNPNKEEWMKLKEMFKPFSDVEYKIEIANPKRALIQEHLSAMIDPNWHKILDDMTHEGLKASAQKRLKGLLHDSDAGLSAPMPNTEPVVNVGSGETSSSTSADPFDPMQFLNLAHYDSKPEPGY